MTRTSDTLIENEALKIENKSLHGNIEILKKQLENEEENNLDNENAKSFIIQKLRDERNLLKNINRNAIDNLSIQKGKSYALGILTGIMLSTIIINILKWI